MNVIQENISARIEKGQKIFAWLIDPDKDSISGFESKLKNLDLSGVDIIFLGGSLLMKDTITEYIHVIRKYSDLQIVLFPGSTNQVNENADGILLLSLISGRNPDFLIGRHVESAAILKQSSLEILPTAYMLIDSGVPTTASYISNTQPIPHHKTDIAISTAMAGEMLGLKYVFLDAGSGALMPVSAEMISGVKKNIKAPLIVGGGIKNVEQMEAAYNAGADIIVVGNVIEKNIETLNQFTKAKKSFQAI